MNYRQLLVESFHAAIAATDPLKVLQDAIPSPPRGRTFVVGAGKAAAAMALSLERHWPAHAPLTGMVLTRHGHGVQTSRIQVIEAGHPVPDEAGEAAAGRMLSAAGTLNKEDLMLALISGGGSSLLALPAAGLRMSDLKVTTRALLNSGAPIQEINIVRKHLSRVLGGQLSVATQARVLALVISDVIGDDPSDVASGPCAPDKSTYLQALEVIARFGIECPPRVMEHLRLGSHGVIPETPKPDDPAFLRVEHRLIARSRTALEAAESYFLANGITARVLGDSFAGDARAVASLHAAEAANVARQLPLGRRPLALISGGESTVRVSGAGRGGRCTEFLLQLAMDSVDVPLWALACDTDGIDGTQDNAGAVLTPDSLQRAAALGLDPALLAGNHDTWLFFQSIGDLVITGPTRTNVNEYRVILLP